MKKRYTIACCLVISLVLNLLQAQTTIAFQGGEGTAADNWGFVAPTNAGGPIPPGAVAALPRTGSFALRAGGGNTTGCGGGANCIAGGGATTCPMHSNTLQFNAVNTTCFSGVQLTVYHRSHTACSGSGYDASDNLNFEVRLNGGAWTTVQTLTASSDYTWTYASNPAGVPANVPNPWVYNVPNGTVSFEFRARTVVNRSDEVFYLDDVRLTTTTTGYGIPGVAGLWNGIQDNNWFNACNWDNRTVPTAVTNVVFPVGSNNDIVIQNGQNCQCNNLTMTGTTGRKIKGEGSPTKVLTCFGNININAAPTSDVLDFDDGTAGTPDGTINLHGNWNNNCDEADFEQGEATVNLLGSGTQTISLATVQPYEVFYNLVVNKPAGTLVLGKSVQVENILTLTNGKVVTNANHAHTLNTAVGAVTGQSTASYIQGNLRREILSGAGTRTYEFPLGTAANYEWASLTLTNPTGVNFIDGFFNPTIGGTPPALNEGGFLYNTILDAGIWTLTPSPSFTGIYDLSLSERGYTNGGASSYIDAKRPDAGYAWTNPGTHITFSEIGGVVNCQRSGLTSFSDFAIALSNNPFAVQTLTFEAMPQSDATVALDWTWVDVLEGNFDLLRIFESASSSVGAWEVGKVYAMATIDTEAPIGLVRYELYHTDLNGARSLVASDEVWNSGTSKGEPRIWPNPTGTWAQLQLRDQGEWKLDILRADGAQVLEMAGEAAEVMRAFESASAQLSVGIYMVRLTNQGKSFTLKFIHQ